MTGRGRVSGNSGPTIAARRGQDVHKLLPPGYFSQVSVQVRALSVTKFEISRPTIVPHQTCRPTHRKPIQW